MQSLMNMFAFAWISEPDEMRSLGKLTNNRLRSVFMARSLHASETSSSARKQLPINKTLPAQPSRSCEEVSGVGGTMQKIIPECRNTSGTFVCLLSESKPVKSFWNGPKVPELHMIVG
jgi:hypothetical protein